MTKNQTKCRIIRKSYILGDLNDISNSLIIDGYAFQWINLNYTIKDNLLVISTRIIFIGEHAFVHINNHKFIKYRGSSDVLADIGVN